MESKQVKLPVSVLLVEDNEMDIQNIKRAFKKLEMKNPLYIATSGEKAFELLNSKEIKPSPKIIILDISMPEMTGIDFLKELRQDPKYKSLLVFILTVSDKERDRVDAYKSGISGYMTKPMHSEDFIIQIKRLSMLWSLFEFTD